MKKILLIILVLVMTFGYSQLSLTKPITITQIPKHTDKILKYTIGLSNNFYRGYIYTYLSKDKELSDDDIMLGAKRVFGDKFDNGAVVEINYIIAKNVLKGKYYLISRVEVHPKVGEDWYKQNFSSNQAYCINLQDDFGCDPPSVDKKLEFKKFKITYDNFKFDSSESFPPAIILQEQKLISYYLTVKNPGVSKNIDMDLVILKAPKYNANNVIGALGRIKFGTIDYGQTKEASFTHFYYNSFNLQINKDYYLYFNVDGIEYYYKFRYINSSNKGIILENVIVDENIQVSPNPNSGIFQILVKDILEGEIQILDVNGKQIFTEKVKGGKNLNVNIQSYPSGVYIMRFQSEGQVVTKKIIKN